MYQSADNNILMYIHEHAVELSPCVPCVCTYLPTCYMYEYVYIYIFCHVYINLCKDLYSNMYGWTHRQDEPARALRVYISICAKIYRQIRMYEHTDELSPRVPCLCIYTPTCCMYAFVWIFTFFKILSMKVCFHMSYAWIYVHTIYVSIRENIDTQI